jgi:polyisoprenoid-binding protein YceI
MIRLLLLCILVLNVQLSFSQTWIPADDKSAVTFKIKNFGTTVDGSFKGLAGTIEFDEKTPTAARFDVTLNATSIDTGIKMRDNHLRKEDYFHVSQYPTIRFSSSQVTITKAGTGTVTGNLTIKKTTREISFPFTYTLGANTIQFSGEFEIDRRDYEVGGNSMTMADKLSVKLNVVAIKK